MLVHLLFAYFSILIIERKLLYFGGILVMNKVVKQDGRYWLCLNKAHSLEDRIEFNRTVGKFTGVKIGVNRRDGLSYAGFSEKMPTRLWQGVKCILFGVATSPMCLLYKMCVAVERALGR